MFGDLWSVICGPTEQGTESTPGIHGVRTQPSSLKLKSVSENGRPEAGDLRTFTVAPEPAELGLLALLSNSWRSLVETSSEGKCSKVGKHDLASIPQLMEAEIEVRRWGKRRLLREFQGRQSTLFSSFTGLCGGVLGLQFISISPM